MTRRITFNHWEATYCPIQNPLDEDASFDGMMFETYGDELQQVQSTPRSHIWTLVDADGVLWVMSGYRFVNRIGYFITEHPWTEETDVDTD